MTRRLAIPVAAVAVLGVFAAQATGAQKIANLSHTHPSGKDFSYFCGKLKGKAKKAYTVTVDGPAVKGDDEKVVQMNKKGKARVKFKIEAAGPYEMTLSRRGNEIDTEGYFVPPPPTPETGPFRC